MFKVFLVEDEIVVREGIRKNISWERYGFEYAGDASDGELALPLIRQIRPDLLITDIKMPFMDGLSLIELVRRELPSIRIVIISGYDDFAYAQKAIGLGVDQYLLKPILKDKLAEVLTELHRKMQAELAQQAHVARFAREAREYEMDSRRRFFEKLVTGGPSVSEISDTARSMGIDVNAPSYNIVLYCLSSAAFDGSAPERYTDVLAQVQERVTQCVVGHPEFILFRWNITTYAVLVKGDADDIAQRSQDCVGNIQAVCESAGCDVDWHIACGTPVARLGAIPACFAEVNRVLSYRYLCPDEHVLTEASIRSFRKGNGRNEGTGNVEIDRERIHLFLMGGTEREIGRFIDQLLQSAGEDAELPLYNKYLAMTICYAAAEYLYSIGCRGEDFWPLDPRPEGAEARMNGGTPKDTCDSPKEADSTSTPEAARQTAYRVLKQAIARRDGENRKRQSTLLHQAIQFMDDHYQDETISLDRVARQVNISPNYFSAMFSQEIGQTFIEHLTGKRIEEARRLLRQTDMRSSEIAAAVGYKDPHYFSFVFRKVAGCTPSDYRRGNRVCV